MVHASWVQVAESTLKVSCAVRATRNVPSEVWRIAAEPTDASAPAGSIVTETVRPLTVPELVDILGRSDLLLCNDSGPGHIAAACGRPVIPIFGPTDPGGFRPWGDQHHLVIRDICPWRPCFDYCKFREPYCLTKLLPERVWPEIENHVAGLIARGVLPKTLDRLDPVTAS